MKLDKQTIIIGAILFSSLIASIMLEREQQQVQALWRLRREKEVRVNQLVDLSIKYPDWRDLLLRLAIAQWELGNDQAASDALNRANYLDPTYPAADELKKILTPSP